MPVADDGAQADLDALGALGLLQGALADVYGDLRVVHHEDVGRLRARAAGRLEGGVGEGGEIG